MKLILKIGWKVLVALAVVLIVMNTFFIPNNYASCNLDKIDPINCHQVDAVVVVSGGDTKARALYGTKLYQAKLTSKIVMSGAAHQTNVSSNAEEMAKIAIAAGVPSRDLIIETKSRDTHQNAQFVKEIIKNNRFRKVALVTSPYHQRRAHLEFKQALGKDALVYNAPIKNDKHWSPYWWWLKPANWKLAIKELGGLLTVGLRTKK